MKIDKLIGKISKTKSQKRKIKKAYNSFTKRMKSDFIRDILLVLNKQKK